MNRQKKIFYRRQLRTRTKLRSVSGDKLRLSVFRSGKNIYAQLVDDSKRATLVAASTLDKELDSVKNGGNKAAASEVGKLLAVRALAKGVTDIMFDRGGYAYHGRIKALADAAREHGLKF